MTEVERIISKGLISSDYLNEEYKCDFLISSTRKKIWAIELELLVEFDKLCKKYDLFYFLIYGTLLGAIRHKGFIPWDDDIDVMMPRTDYEKLIKLSKEFPFPLFLQAHNTDKEYCASYARLRNTNTTAVSKMFQYQKMNQGIFLDIFPYDNSNGIDETERFQKIDALNKENATYMRLTNPELDEKNKLRVSQYSGRNPSDTLKEIEDIATKLNKQKTEYVCSLVCTMGKYDFFRKEDIETTKLCEYEGFKFPIPSGYDNVLKELFGNYMEFPAVEKRGTQHSHYIFDPDRPFSDYIKSI